MRNGIAVLTVLLCSAQGMAAERTAWFRDSGWGVFIHYLAKSVDVPVEEWNKWGDGFDVEGPAAQLESTGTGYLILTIGQNSGHYLAPNKTYDNLTGIRPRKCSRRDLISDM